MKFKKYAELISCLHVAKQNNDFLLKNHESHPTDLTTFSEVNVVINESNCGCGRGRRHGYSRKCSRGHNHGGSNSHPKWGKIEINYVNKTNNSEYGDIDTTHFYVANFLA